MRGLIALISLLGSILVCDSAWASCKSDWLDIEEVSNNNGLTLAASNRSEYPITFTIDVDLRRLQPSRETTFTESLSPGESRPVIDLTRADPERKGRYWFETWCTIGNRNADHNDDVYYLMPYEQSKSYRVLQGYGSRFSHTGRETYSVDFNMREGTPVHAARGGVVAAIEESNWRGCWEDGCGRYANYIIIVHDDETTGEYYHLQQHGALVEPGEIIEAGQLIGLSGNTGHTTMPHLHFGVYRADKWGKEQSIPVRFMTANGVIDRPRRGGRYFATTPGRHDNAESLQSSTDRVLR